MNNNDTFINNVNTEKILSIIFIIIGVVNIVGDNLLIKFFRTNDIRCRIKSNQIFLFGLIVSFLLYIVIVSRNYSFYIQKKESGQDATPELERLFGSLLILAGFAIIFNFFLKNNFNTSNTPVL